MALCGTLCLDHCGTSILDSSMEAEDHPFIYCQKKLKENPKPLEEPRNYMENNFSLEDDTSKVSSKAGEGCYSSQSKIILSPSAVRWGIQCLGETEWKRKSVGSETHCAFEEIPAKKSPTRRLPARVGVGQGRGRVESWSELIRRPRRKVFLLLIKLADNGWLPYKVFFNARRKGRRKSEGKKSSPYATFFLKYS